MAEKILENSEIQRYSRQLILPEIGIKGQEALKKTRVLIVGAGGLGCPAALYLAAAGIGTLGILDYDEVEISNLHRQILHTEEREGTPKANSASCAIKSLNHHVKVIAHITQLNSENGLDIVSQYDIVVDATDNVATRYLINDACVLCNKPLVSGSALRFEGQLTVYNHEGGPCYRCLFPEPPPPHTVTNCSDGGVLGVVPGIIGSLQALEVIKLATGMDANGQGMAGRMLLFDGLRMTFTQIKLRSRKAACVMCGENPSIKQLIDYVQFCGARPSDKDKGLELLEGSSRITVKELDSILKEDQPRLLLDVRSQTEMDICRLPDFVNFPIGELQSDAAKKRLENLHSTGLPVYVICRRGNDSQKAVLRLREILGDSEAIKDVIGGLHSWSSSIDPSFPVY